MGTFEMIDFRGLNNIGGVTNKSLIEKMFAENEFQGLAPAIAPIHSEYIASSIPWDGAGGFEKRWGIPMCRASLRN